MAWRGQVKWAVCSYEDRAEAWADTQRRSESQLVLVVNASVEGQPIGAHQRRAKWHHRARLVEAVWQLHGTEAYDFFWFLDEDISFRGFELLAFIHRWACAAGAAGPPVVASPTLREAPSQKQHFSSQVWSHAASTYRLCLGGELGGSYGADACFLRAALALRSDWIEQWGALVDGRFLVWFLQQPTAKWIREAQLRHNSDSGMDVTWCGAAEEWLALTAGGRVTPRPSCVVVTVPVTHDDARTQDNSLSGRYVQSGLRVLRDSGLQLSQWKMHHGYGCHGRNCTTHPWWRYQPTMHWELPVSEDGVAMVRACVSTRLACPGIDPGGLPDGSPGGLLPSDRADVHHATEGISSRCGGLSDLWWSDVRSEVPIG